MKNMRGCDMDKQDCLQTWLHEEQNAHIKGWDFSHLSGRMEEEMLPWDYPSVIRQYLTPEMDLLDIDTGGGEFLLSLGHPYGKTGATENYLPNVLLCEETLLSLGIDFKQADGAGELPFADESFDMVINRHGDYEPSEIYRVLKPGGWFITQQVGAENDRDLVQLLLNAVPEMPFPQQYLDIATEKFRKCGFTILRGQEAFPAVRFYDVGALVWFAHIIQWEFPGFSVENSLDKLYGLQERLAMDGEICGTTHRFLLVAKK